VARPTLESSEAFTGVILLASFVILTTDNQNVVG
jgi:hypothetical protein